MDHVFIGDNLGTLQGPAIRGNIEEVVMVTRLSNTGGKKIDSMVEK